MSMATVALTAGVASSAYGAYSANRNAKAQLGALSDQQAALQKAQAQNMAMLNPLLERGASDYQQEAVSSNNAQYGGIQSLMNKFGGFQRGDISKNSQTVNDLVMQGAREMGVDPQAMMAAMTQSGMSTMMAGKEQQERARGLINGDYYNTPVGQQASANMVGAMAPYMSITGRNQSQALGGTGPAGEVDLITQFLMNGQENARYGDSLLGEGVKLSETGSNRLGGVLAAGMNQGQFGAQMGNSMTNNLMNIGAGQLINPNDAMRSDALKAGVLGSLISGNMGAAGLLGQAAGGVTSSANQAIASGVAGISSSIGDYAKYQQSSKQTDAFLEAYKASH